MLALREVIRIRRIRGAGCEPVREATHIAWLSAFPIHFAGFAAATRSRNSITMRIAFFSTMGGLPWGGSEELWCRAAQSLLERGHEVAFNCVKWPTPAAPVQRLIDAG